MLPPLATVDDFETWTGQTGYDEDLMSALLLRASSAVRAETGQTISRVENDTLTIPYGGPHLLPQVPADTPTLITVNGQAITGWQLVGQQLVGVTDYGQPSWWQLPMIVTYSHGYRYDQIPDEVVAVVCDAAARQADNPENIRQVGNVTFGSETIGSITLTEDEVRRARRAMRLPTVMPLSVQ